MSTANSAPTNFPANYAQQDDSGTLYGVAIAFIILETIFVGLRYYSRYLIKAKLGIDDMLMVPALLSAVSVAALLIAMIQYGAAGRHTDYIIATQPETYVTFNKLQFALVYAYIPAVTFPKLAVIALMLRIFPQRPFRIACSVIAGILVTAATVNIIIGFLLCTPMHAIWDLSVPNAKCLNLNAYYRWGGGVNIITDVALIILPIPVIAKMSLSTGVKVGLVATFTTGGLSIVVSVLRFETFLRLNESADILYVCATIGIYTILETGGYLIAACLLAFRSLVRVLSEGLVSQGNSSIDAVFGILTWRRSAKFSGSGGTGRSRAGEKQGHWYRDTLPLTSLDLQPDNVHPTSTVIGRSSSEAASTIQEGADTAGKNEFRSHENAIKISHKVDVTHGP